MEESKKVEGCICHKLVDKSSLYRFNPPEAHGWSFVKCPCGQHWKTAVAGGSHWYRIDEAIYLKVRDAAFSGPCL
jgi:hypothetical protein